MKILLTHERFAPDFAGGGEYVVLETARCLIESGIDVRVVTTGDPRITEYDGIETVRLPISRYRMHLATRQIAPYAHDVDLIHTFNYHACIPSLKVGRRAGKPVVCLIMGLFQQAWKEMRGPILGRVWMAWERYIVTRPYDRTLFASDFSREDGLALGVSPKRSVVTQPGIHVEDFAPAAIKDDVILFVGKLCARKGVDDLIAAAQALPEARFRLVGWGPRAKTLRSSAPPNVEILDFERGAKLREHFGKARIFLLPSRAETFGIALVEAMASGCAVISSVPLDFAGERVAAGDVPGLVAAIRRLWQDAALTTRLGAENVDKAKVHTWQRYATSLESLYREVLAEHTQAAPCSS